MYIIQNPIQTNSCISYLRRPHLLAQSFLPASDTSHICILQAIHHPQCLCQLCLETCLPATFATSKTLAGVECRSDLNLLYIATYPIYKDVSFERPKEFGADMITFFLGPQEQEFCAHKNYVCHYSPVLNAMFNGVWAESASSKVH